MNTIKNTTPHINLNTKNIEPEHVHVKYEPEPVHEKYEPDPVHVKCEPEPESDDCENDSIKEEVLEEDPLAGY